MGFYTNVDKTLGLNLNPRLERIIKETQEGKQPSIKDTEFLIDESARFSTIANRIRKGKFKIEDSFLDQKYDLKEVLGDLMVELENIHAHNIGRDGTYTHELRHFNPNSEYNIEKLSPSRIETELSSALRMVRDLQQTFDDNEDSLEVNAYFVNLEKDYGLQLTVTAVTTLQEILPIVINQVVSVVEKEANEKKNAVDRLKRLTEK